MKDEQIKKEELKAFALEDEALESVAEGGPLGEIYIKEPSTGMNIRGTLQSNGYFDTNAGVGD